MKVKRTIRTPSMDRESVSAANRQCPNHEVKVCALGDGG